MKKSDVEGTVPSVTLNVKSPPGMISIFAGRVKRAPLATTVGLSSDEEQLAAEMGKNTDIIVHIRYFCIGFIFLRLVACFQVLVDCVAKVLRMEWRDW